MKRVRENDDFEEMLETLVNFKGREELVPYRRERLMKYIAFSDEELDELLALRKYQRQKLQKIKVIMEEEEFCAHLYKINPMPQSRPPLHLPHLALIKQTQQENETSFIQK